MERRFMMVPVTELPATFQNIITEQDLDSFAVLLKIPSQFVKHEIVFAVPICDIGMAYKHWFQTQAATMTPSQQALYVEPRMTSVSDYVKCHGLEGLRDFHSSLHERGHPFQPVRVLRDAREQKPDTLTDTVAYRAA